jgi:hypothetical protein
MLYEVLFFDGWGDLPAYYLLDGVEGDTPEQALTTNIERITQQVRARFGLLAGELSDRQIQDTIYVLRENGLVCARDVARSRER